MKNFYSPILMVALAVVAMLPMIGCGGESVSKAGESETKTSVSGGGGFTPKQMANALYAVMKADRTVYAKHVVTNLKKAGSDTTPSEYWEDEEGTIPLPAQMFRMGAEIVDENPAAGFTYRLRSKWPLNDQNKPQSKIEEEGLDYIAENPDETFYGEETLGDKTYFTAIYGDKAVAQACWECHNEHANRGDDYPEFKKGDVMGGVVLRIPLN